METALDTTFSESELRQIDTLVHPVKAYNANPHDLLNAHGQMHETIGQLFWIMSLKQRGEYVANGTNLDGMTIERLQQRIDGLKRSSFIYFTAWQQACEYLGIRR